MIVNDFCMVEAKKFDCARRTSKKGDVGKKEKKEEKKKKNYEKRL